MRRDEYKFIDFSMDFVYLCAVRFAENDTWGDWFHCKMRK